MARTSCFGRFVTLSVALYSGSWIRAVTRVVPSSIVSTPCTSDCVSHVNYLLLPRVFLDDEYDVYASQVLM
jgi:hypothetical protein